VGSAVARRGRSSGNQSILAAAAISSNGRQRVHWFTAESETAFLFNVHVNNTDPGNPNNPGRVYVDPLGEKLSGGLVKAPKVSYGRVNQLYG
jgi:hypothetical protein